tara:strand:- start:2557 stop:3189 length:633 start_codon:yes stop_codon:yes gene_type:complete
LHWRASRYFNYTPEAGGLGRSTLRRVSFTPPDANGVARLEVPDYPPLPYQLDGQVGLVGERVVARGLRGRPDLNGKVGLVQAYEAATGRYAVRFDDGGETLKLFSLNVECSSEDAGAATGGVAGLGSLAATLPKRRQALVIANFPRHEVTRLADSWEWRISNHNATFVSCDEAGTLSYAMRGFSTEREQVIDPALAAAEAAAAAAAAAEG